MSEWFCWQCWRLRFRYRIWRIYEPSPRLRLRLIKLLMPRGYALWEYGRYSDDGLDAMVLAKDPDRGVSR